MSEEMEIMTEEMVEILTELKKKENFMEDCYIEEEEEGYMITPKWWDYISWSFVLSEEFIRKFQDKLDWSCITGSQKLSKEFILEFQDKLDWWKIMAFKKWKIIDIEKK